ncbi:hypothetical protein BDN67DRAFT_1017348 [Paxillus ammoniavirescens]|nr:hypothetical protein BDN67DRAFT_1017348 [Paxillus ammoniavirescens]
MLQLEWDELPINNFTVNPSSQDGGERSDVPDDDDTLITLAVESSARHPLRSPSIPCGSCFSTRTITPSETVTGAEGETRPRLTRLLKGLSDDSVAESNGPGDTTAPSDEPEPGSDIIVHEVGPTDTIAGVALRYGISIAALRRANQLWPSDPIHLRTELIIPRGNTLRVRSPIPGSRKAHTVYSSDDEPLSRSSSDVLVSTLIATRSAILSVFPARMSLESLSSRTSVSEDHELHVVRTAPPSVTSSDESHNTLGTHQSHEVTATTSSHARYQRSIIPPFTHLPCAPTDDYTRSDLNYTSLVSNSCLPSAVYVPVRTLQLEPEPGMELPIRGPRD